MNTHKIKILKVLLSAEPFPVRFNAKQYKINKKKQTKTNKSRKKTQKKRRSKGSHLIRISLICLIRSDSSLKTWSDRAGQGLEVENLADTMSHIQLLIFNCNLLVS